MTEKPKHVRDMSEAEYKEAVREATRPKPVPIIPFVPGVDKDARDMTAKEYAEALRKRGIRDRHF